VAGNTNKTCVDQSLLVPPELIEAITVAWTEADKLLKIPISRISTAGDNSAPADVVDAAKIFRLESVDVLVGSERVLFMSGCITAKPSEGGGGDGTDEEYTSRKASTGGEDVVDQCGQVSESIKFLKSKILDPKADKNCRAEMIAGFALRSSNREIILTANFTVAGRSFSFSADPFDINRIEVLANASASISTFASAILPLPPPIKAAAAGLLDKIGSVSFSGQMSNTDTVIADRSYSRANYPDYDLGREGNKGMMRVSKLAVKIARGILRPICREAKPLLGGPNSNNVEDCDLRPMLAYPGTLEALSRYREIPVVRCKADINPGEVTFFALAPAPDKAAKEVDFLVTGGNPTKLSVYEKKNDVVAALNYRTWSTYLGENRTGMCGTVPAGKRCIATKVGVGALGVILPGFNGTNVQCNEINSKKIDLKLSLASDKTMQPL
jgi:hypothetical protein